MEWAMALVIYPAIYYPLYELNLNIVVVVEPGDMWIKVLEASGLPYGWGDL